ncbi:hypothetical protein LXL04_022755 [Taraxacum kok-saghyz]
MDEAGPSIEEIDRGPMYDSDFEQSDFEDGSSTSSERGFVADEELEDSDPDDVELKFCLTNYAVSNGYPICITKSSSFRLQAKCGFDKKGKRCPFKLWASWMGDEHSFQCLGDNVTGLRRRLWAVSGIPCIHACAAMNFTHHQPQDYISEWFTKKKFAETYIGNIRPLNGSNMWARAPYTKPLPPIVRRMQGRPKIRRRKHVTEVDKGGYKRIRASGGTKICTNYWQKGHNKRTCKNPTTSQPTQLRKKMGRPRTRYREESTNSQPTQPTQPTQTTRNPTPKETGKKKGETSDKGKEKMDADGRGKEKMDASVTEKGLQDIPVIMDFTDHKLVADLLRSRYSEDTIYQALDNEELHVDVGRNQRLPWFRKQRKMREYLKPNPPKEC